MAEADEAFHARVIFDPEICGGRPHIKGTRVEVADILDLLAEGVSAEEIVEEYPYLSGEHVKAALGYAAASARHRVIAA